MRIDRLKLDNFRCFESRAFDLAERFALLVGDNGKGKTAVLDALSVAAGAWLLGIPEAPARSIRPDEVRRASYVVGGVGTLEPQTPTLVSCTGVIDGQEVGWGRGLASVDGRTNRRGAVDISRLASEACREVQAGRPVALPLISYYGTGRLWVQKRQRSTEPFARGSRLRGLSTSARSRSLSEKGHLN
jgi:predicted ATP-binding protein involved in virulence